VYNEMVTSWTRPEPLYHAAGLTVYGPDHPPHSIPAIAGGAAHPPAGGHPEVPRGALLPGQHGSHSSLPKDVDLPAALARFDAELNRLEPRTPSYPCDRSQVPAFRPPRRGASSTWNIRFATKQQPGTVMLPWPADRKLTNRERTLLSLFLDNVAGGADTIFTSGSSIAEARTPPSAPRA